MMTTTIFDMFAPLTPSNLAKVDHFPSTEIMTQWSKSWYRILASIVDIDENIASESWSFHSLQETHRERKIKNTKSEIHFDTNKSYVADKFFNILNESTNPPMNRNVSTPISEFKTYVFAGRAKN